MKPILGYLFVSLGICIIFFVLYAHTPFYTVIRPFSSHSLLASSWEKYKSQFINKDGRVIDYTHNSITTSEGQSYALLRSVWIGDKSTFDTVWKFTKLNLKRPKDNLFSWQWGKLHNGKYGVLPNGGINTATDADEDIALALILASRRWNDNSYASAAKDIIGDIWDKETGNSQNNRYIIAGNWADSQTEIILNPSYFSPYAWRLFANIDKQHDWKSLITPAYALLTTSGESPLDKKQTIGLPPDWIAMDKNSGSLKPVNIRGLTTNYSFDAMRVPWRVSLDYQWNHEEKAKLYLTDYFTKLITDYQTFNKLAGVYAHDGSVVVGTENPMMYATIIGAFMVSQPGLAKKIYQEKIVGLYSNDTNTFNKELPYYDQNWLWFGAALYNKVLLNY